MKFRVIRGTHNEGGVTYSRGEVVDSKMDLGKLNAVGAIKFQRVDSSDPVGEAAKEGFFSPEKKQEAPTPDPYNFESMTIPDLKKFASEEQIDLGTATSKKDIVAVLKTALDNLLKETA